MIEPKDLQEEFITSFKALLIRYSVYIADEGDDFYLFKNEDDTIDISLKELYNNHNV